MADLLDGVGGVRMVAARRRKVHVDAMKCAKGGAK
jgi:hypothetical protein